MGPKRWLNDNDPKYIGLLSVSTICIALLIACSVLGIVTASFEPVIDPAAFAAAGTIFAVVAQQMSDSDTSVNGA